MADASRSPSPASTRSGSITRRTATLAAVAGALLLAAAGTALHANLSAATVRQFANQQRDQALALAIFADLDDDLALRAPPYLARYGGHYWQIEFDAPTVGSDSGTRAQQRDTPQTLIRSPSLGDYTLPPGDRVEGPLGEPLQTASARIRSQRATLTVAADLTDTLALNRALALRLAAGLSLIWLLLVLAVTLATWRGLGAVRRLSRAVDALASGRNSTVPADQPQELQPLAAQLNRLAEAHRNRIDRQRRATTQLAHALRTPLTVLQTSATQASTVDSETVRQSVARMLPLVEDELARARIHGPMPGLTDTDVASQARRAASLCRVDHHLPAGAIDIDADDEGVAIEAGDLLTVLWNLMDNACKHGSAPVRVTARGNTIVIEDSGRADLAGRADGIQQKAPSNSGNGMRLVRDILGVYGWAMTISDSALGGRKVSLQPRQHTA